MNQKTTQKRIINFRKPFVVLVGIVIGILLSYNFFVDDCNKIMKAQNHDYTKYMKWMLDD